MKPKIKIENVGPIVYVEMELNKINVFMGSQSSGKSTIAKIISYCTWVEKDVATSQSLEEYQKGNDYFKEHLEKFHKLKGYFKSNSYIFYESDVVKFEYSINNFSIEWKDKYAYKRSKISYVPAERNMVTLPEVKKVEFGNSYIRSFLFDWFDARKNYSKEATMPILDLMMKYYYNENSDEDHIVENKNGDSYDILLNNASSGLQSITPLLAMMDYLTNWLYTEVERKSFEQEEKRRNTNRKLIDELVLKKRFSNHNEEKRAEEIEELNKKLSENDEFVRRLHTEWKSVEKMLFSTQNTQFIIEEPEQNLFPKTQRDLVYHLLEKCLDGEREHRLTITTHSPYILYALNNCMLGSLIDNKLNEDEKAEFLSKNAWLSPNKVNVFQIEDGKLRSIKNKKTGTVDKHYFNGIMKEIMDEYIEMLNIYSNEEQNK